MWSATLMIACFLGLYACKSGGLETQDAGRWKPYAGCNENQCRSWNSGCQADCMNSQKKIDADSCMNQCRGYFDDCMKSCK
jgi:hypothetical protein